ncbi:hypothetical protein [Sinobaca sp. H24]|nr:hypothetical protein [Sinobaca sp. H24]
MAARKQEKEENAPVTMTNLLFIIFLGIVFLIVISAALIINI